jgi:hypothetical protein
MQLNFPAQNVQGPTPRVVDDFAQAVPVGAQELDVVETYLGPFLNALIGPQE